jgi:hypothetical protein
MIPLARIIEIVSLMLILILVRLQAAWARLMAYFLSLAFLIAFNLL